MPAAPLYSRYFHPELASKMEARVEVDPLTGCWNWTGGTNADGYGYGLYVDGKQTRAHRVAYMVANGYLPPRDVFVCHLCSNPSCCRPEHLAAGSAWDNAQDTKGAGRLNKATRRIKADALAALLGAEGTYRAISERFGVSLSTVARRRRDSGVKSPRTFKLTEADVRAIRASDEESKVLAERFGVTAPNIHAVRTRKTWRHVT